jgi:hypothetical protein
MYSILESGTQRDRAQRYPPRNRTLTKRMTPSSRMTRLSVLLQAETDSRDVVPSPSSSSESASSPAFFSVGKASHNAWKRTARATATTRPYIEGCTVGVAK